MGLSGDPKARLARSLARRTDGRSVGQRRPAPQEFAAASRGCAPRAAAASPLRARRGPPSPLTGCGGRDAAPFLGRSCAAATSVSSSPAAAAVRTPQSRPGPPRRDCAAGRGGRSARGPPWPGRAGAPLPRPPWMRSGRPPAELLGRRLWLEDDRGSSPDLPDHRVGLAEQVRGAHPPWRHPDTARRPSSPGLTGQPAAGGFV